MSTGALAAGRGLLDKARRPNAVKADDVKAGAAGKTVASVGKAAPGATVAASPTGGPVGGAGADEAPAPHAARSLFGSGDPEEETGNPFAGRNMGGAAGGRGRGGGRLQASQWSLAAEAKSSKRTRCVPRLPRDRSPRRCGPC